MVLGVLVCLAYPEVVFGSSTFFFRDFGFFGYPLAHYHRQSFWHGEIPLWNPLNNCGLPFLAQWNTLVLYPGALFYLFVPLSWSLSMFCLGHLFLAGLNMYFLAFRWTGNRLAACTAGLTFALNGLTLNCLMWPNNIAALGWMPLVVLSVERAWQQRTPKHVAAGALIGAMQMLTGAPELIVFTWSILAVLLAVEVVRRHERRFQPLLRFTPVVLLVAALSAAQLLPFLDLLKQSQRDEGFGHSHWSMPGTGWANLLVPLFYSYEGRHGVFFQVDQVWTSSYYVGIGTVTLALAAFWRPRAGRIWTLGAIAVFGSVLALGENGYLYAWLQQLLPQFGFMRYPVKFVTITVFCLPLLAAFGVSRLREGIVRQSPWWRAPLPVAGAVVTLLIAGLLAFAYYVPPPWGAWKETWQNGLGRALFCWAILGALLMACRFGRTQPAVLAATAALVLMAIDALKHAPNQNPTLPRTILAPRIVRLNPQPTHGESRALISKSAYLRIQTSFSSQAMNDLLAGRAALFPNANLLDDIPTVNGFYSLNPREEQDISGPWFKRTDGAYPTNLLDFLGVAHISSARSVFEFELRTNAMPFASAGQKPVYAPHDVSMSIIRDGEFHPREEVYLPVEVEPVVIVTNRTEARVLSSTFAAHQATIEVQAAQPSMVVIAQTCYPRWRAFVDGRRALGLRANHAYQAVQVPAGQHTVKLVYHDSHFYRGALISVLALVGCGVLWRRQGKFSIQE
jgi:membrane protein YfhO